MFATVWSSNRHTQRLISRSTHNEQPAILTFVRHSRLSSAVAPSRDRRADHLPLSSAPHAKTNSFPQCAHFNSQRLWKHWKVKVFFSGKASRWVRRIDVCEHCGAPSDHRLLVLDNNRLDCVSVLLKTFVTSFGRNIKGQALFVEAITLMKHKQTLVEIGKLFQCVWSPELQQLGSCVQA